jgi:tetratricopeptide (TPR) repeat protein
MKIRTLLTTILALAVALAFVSGCAKTRKAGGQMDTPEVHYDQGMKYYNGGDFARAGKEFELSRTLDLKYAPAYAGLALCEGEKGRASKDPKEKEKCFDKAEENLDKAMDLSDGKLVAAWLAKGMIITMQHMADKDQDWVEDAIDAYDKVINKLDKENSEAYYRKGWTLKWAYKFREAAEQFKKVLDLKKDFTREADEQWKIMQDIERAAPGSKVGMRIALIEKIGRADVAALFVSELDVTRLIEKKRPKNYDTGFKAPSDARALQADSVVKIEQIKDIKGHWAENFITDIVNLQVRGLEPYPDHTFQPDLLITRGEYAFMLEDVLIAILREEALATKYIDGTASRFPDVNASAPYYNAICNMVDKNIMNANINSEFEPTRSVSGTEALLAIRAMKELKK